MSLISKAFAPDSIFGGTVTPTALRGPPFIPNRDISIMKWDHSSSSRSWSDAVVRCTGPKAPLPNKACTGQGEIREIHGNYRHHRMGSAARGCREVSLFSGWAQHKTHGKCEQNGRRQDSREFRRVPGIRFDSGAGGAEAGRGGTPRDVGCMKEDLRNQPRWLAQAWQRCRTFIFAVE